MKLLVVDDDMIIRMVLQKYFSNKQFEVIISENGEEAMELFLDSPDSYDLIITDIMMPIMNGIELAEKIKTFKPDFPIIAITAGNLDQISGNEHLFEGCYNKPLELNKLHEIVISLIPN